MVTDSFSRPPAGSQCAGNYGDCALCVAMDAGMSSLFLT